MENTNNKLKWDIKWYSSQKSAFYNWMGNRLKNNIRTVDENDCKDAWNSAITAAIRAVNKSNDFDVMDNLRKLKIKE